MYTSKNKIKQQNKYCTKQKTNTIKKKHSIYPYLNKSEDLCIFACILVDVEDIIPKQDECLPMPYYINYNRTSIAISNDGNFQVAHLLHLNLFVYNFSIQYFIIKYVSISYLYIVPFQKYIPTGYSINLCFRTIQSNHFPFILLL